MHVFIDDVKDGISMLACALQNLSFSSGPFRRVYFGVLVSFDINVLQAVLQTSSTGFHGQKTDIQIPEVCTDTACSGLLFYS